MDSVAQGLPLPYFRLRTEHGRSGSEFNDFRRGFGIGRSARQQRRAKEASDSAQDLAIQKMGASQN